MHADKQTPPKSVPAVSKAQIADVRAKLAAAGREPLFDRGTISDCPNCGGQMATTNDLERLVATPGLVYVVARLPGARCMTCASTELDGSGVAILETAAPREIVADYETSVTHSSSATLGTYFKMDLARVLGLKGRERLYWRVVDRDSAIVRIRRAEAGEEDPSPKLNNLMIATAGESPDSSGQRRRRSKRQQDTVTQRA